MIDLVANREAFLEEVEAIARCCSRSPQAIEVVAISKRRSVEAVGELYASGQTLFGENRVDELLERLERLPRGIKWHFIGPLQRNKVGKLIGHVALIHSIDTIELAQKVSQVSEERGVVTPILLQVNTSRHPTKRGLVEEEWLKWVPDLLKLRSVELCGVMAVAPLTQDEGVIRDCFRGLRLFRDRLQSEFGTKIDLRHLSMGMSHDYPIAIEEGATLLRVGTRLFEGTVS